MSFQEQWLRRHEPESINSYEFLFSGSQKNLLEVTFMFDRSKLLPTNVPGVFAFPPMPRDLDPNSAPTATMIKHGLLWRRPTEQDHPAMRSAWYRAFAEGLPAKEHAVPHITHLPKRIHKPSHFDKPLDGLCLPSPVWSGAVVRNPWPDWTGVRTVVGTWVVPTVSKPTWPAGIDGGWISSSWIGLGGYTEPKSASPLLQAGVTHDVDPSGIPNYYAWFAFDFAENKIDDFAIHAGDEVNFSVQYLPSGQTANLTFLNVNTGAYRAMMFGLDNFHVPGLSVEWIVEVPGGGYDIGHVIPQMTPVTFNSAIACNGEVIFANSDRCLQLSDRARQVNRVDFGSTGDSLTVSLV